MLSFISRLSAVVLTLALAAGQVSVCAGWTPTPEARLACCSDDGPCPMHKSDSQHHRTTGGVTQAEADRCCAASQQDDSTPSSNATLFVTLAVVVSPVSALLPEPESHADMSRASAPLPTRHVPKHLLLSVFLV